MWYSNIFVNTRKYFTDPFYSEIIVKIRNDMASYTYEKVILRKSNSSR